MVSVSAVIGLHDSDDTKSIIFILLINPMYFSLVPYAPFTRFGVPHG